MEHADAIRAGSDIPGSASGDRAEVQLDSEAIVVLESWPSRRSKGVLGDAFP